MSKYDINSDLVRAKARKFIRSLTIVLGVFTALGLFGFTSDEMGMSLKEKLSFSSSFLGATLAAWFGGNWVLKRWQTRPQEIVRYTVIAAVAGFVVGVAVGVAAAEFAVN